MIRLSLLFALFLAFPFLISAQNDLFKVPKAIANSCNSFISFQYQASDTSATDNTIYFYFKNAELDTVYRVDSVRKVNDYCEQFFTADSLAMYQLVKGEIFILDHTGKQLNKKPFIDVNLLYARFIVEEKLDPNCQMVAFFGYTFIDNLIVKYEFGNTHLPNILLDYRLPHIIGLPFLVKQKEGWGLMSMDGKMLKECKYERIEYLGQNKFELYTNGILVETIEL